MVETAAFWWPVCPDGYTWLAPEKLAPGYSFWADQSRSRLVPRSDEERLTCPLSESPDLFIRYSELAANPSGESIVNFANRYGQITTPFIENPATRGIELHEWHDQLSPFRAIERHWAKRRSLS